MICPQCDGEGVLWGVLEQSGVHKATEIHFQCDYCEGTGQVIYVDAPEETEERTIEVEEDLSYKLEEEEGWFKKLLDKWNGRK